MTAAAALARAEAAGLRLSLRPDGGVRMEAAAPPPPDVVADLRRWRADLADLLTARQRQAASPAPPPPAWPDGFLYLSGLAVRLDLALRAGAGVVRCTSGAIDLTLPDGRLWLLSPSTVARMADAGLLPAHLADHRPATED